LFILLFYYSKEEERVDVDDGLNESKLEVDGPDTSSFTKVEITQRIRQ
jgi:hypothetical protein